MKGRHRSVWGALLIIACLAASIQPHDEPPKTSTEKAEQARLRDRFKGHRVRQQRLWTVKAADSTLLLTNRFDRSGNLVEQTVFDTSGNSRSVSFYDDGNVWLEELSYGGDTLEERTVFLYNRDSLIDRIISYDNQGRITGQLQYDYRDSTSQICARKTGRPDSLQYTILYAYEPGSRFARQNEAIQRNADGSLRVRTQNRFDGDRRIGKLVFGSDNKLTHSFSYAYTSDGDLSEIRKFTRSDSLVFRQTYRYAPDGLPSEVIERDAGGTIKRTLRYEYDYFDTAG